MDKQEATYSVNQCCGKESLTDSNTSFANENSAKPVWWLNIAPQKFQQELNILLAHGSGRLVWLRIPPDTFRPPFPGFRIRNNGMVDLEISCDANDRYLHDVKSKGKGYDFRPFAVRDCCVSDEHCRLDGPSRTDRFAPTRSSGEHPLTLFPNNVAQFDREIAIILAQLAHFVHPKVVAKIQERNEKEYPCFEQLLSDKIEVRDYLFRGSACVFPGVRRRVSRRGKRQAYNSDDKAIIDDNRFPRHLWTHLVSGRPYSGPMWKQTGLDDFELAHVFAHKESETELEQKFFDEYDTSVRPYGNFTCAANVVLLPKGTVRPTDNSDTIKAVFFKRYIDLYGETPLNGRSEFNHAKIPDWYKELHWNKPALPNSWETVVDSLLKYRSKRVRAILNRN